MPYIIEFKLNLSWIQLVWIFSHKVEFLLYVAFPSFVHKVVKVFILLMWLINTTDEMFDKNIAVISNEFISYCSTRFYATGSAESPGVCV